MRNLFLIPIRLAVGWGISPRVLGIIGISMLVILRLSIGWHFHSEGSAKIRQGDWDAAPFFANAKGPFAEDFRSLVWDRDGMLRRDPANTDWWLGMYREKAAAYYGFGEKENEVSTKALEKVMVDLENILVDYNDDIVEYDLGNEHLQELNQTADRADVESLSGQIETMRTENDAKIKPVLKEIDDLWAGYEATINGLAAPNQRAASPPILLGRPKAARIDTSVLNRIVPYFDLAVGWCLLLGLFTPLAALAAAGFLGSVFLSQYPPGTGPTSSNYQLIECMACLVLAGTGAGRFAGLDYFIHLFIRRSEANRLAEAEDN